MKQLSFVVMGFGLAISLFSCGGDSTPNVENTAGVEQPVDSLALAEDSLNLILRDDPNNLAAYLLRGRVKYNRGNFDGALGDSKRALELDSTSGSAFLLQGEALFSLENFFEAQQSFEDCLENEPENIPCLEKLAEFYLLRRQYDKSMQYVNQALKLNELNHHPYYIKGWIYQERGDSATAASSFQTAIELKPDFYDGYIMLGSLYYTANHPLCLQYFNSALEILPTSTEALYFIAMYHQQNQNSEAALNAYQRMRAIDPQDVRPWYNAGFVNLTQLGQYDSAVYYFSKAVEQDDRYFQAYYNRGLAYLEQGNKDQAVSDFKQSVKINPDYTIAIEALNELNGSK
ncbi:MAG: tetratricopeptide repeat protein [Luteibaculum sp.]